MKKTMMALALCLMSAMTFAVGRQVTTTLPASTPTMTFTIDGTKHVVQPDKATMQEVGNNQVRCIVYAGKDKAEVTLPVSYDTVIELGAKVAEFCHTMGIASDAQYDEFQKWYTQQTKR